MFYLCDRVLYPAMQTLLNMWGTFSMGVMSNGLDARTTKLYFTEAFPLSTRNEQESPSPLLRRTYLNSLNLTSLTGIKQQQALGIC